MGRPLDRTANVHAHETSTGVKLAQLDVLRGEKAEGHTHKVSGLLPSVTSRSTNSSAEREPSAAHSRTPRRRRGALLVVLGVCVALALASATGMALLAVRELRAELSQLREEVRTLRRQRRDEAESGADAAGSSSARPDSPSPPPPSSPHLPPPPPPTAVPSEPDDAGVDVAELARTVEAHRAALDTLNASALLTAGRLADGLLRADAASSTASAALDLLAEQQALVRALNASVTLERTAPRALNSSAAQSGLASAEALAAAVEALVENGTTTREMKLAIGALSRVALLMQVSSEEQLRAHGASGLTRVRTFGHALSSAADGRFTYSAAANVHDHADFEGTLGLGEVGAVLNGVEFTTRHNDYKLRMNSAAALERSTGRRWTGARGAPEGVDAADAANPRGMRTRYHRTAPVPEPEVPPSVLAQPTLERQVEEMREYFRAFSAQNASHRDYRPYFRASLCVLEGAWVDASADALEEPFESDRHRLDAETWSELHAKANAILASGHKLASEDVARLPVSVRGVRADADNSSWAPAVSNWEYRIHCQPLAADVPTRRFRPAADLHVQLGRPAGPRTLDELARSRYARFELNPRTEAQWAGGVRSWHDGELNGPSYLDELMYQVAGKDGPGAVLRDDLFGEHALRADAAAAEGELLNVARYSRYYARGTPGAMGRSVQRRTISDGGVWLARTTHERVTPHSICAEPAAGGARECWTQRWTYAIPLEIVYSTPLTRWDPLRVPAASSSDEAACFAGHTGSSLDEPLCGWVQWGFYRTPADFFDGTPGDTDPADTAVPRKAMRTGSGGAAWAAPSGIWVTLPSIPTVGRVRQRYPIFPVHAHGDVAYKEAHAAARFALDPRFAARGDFGHISASAFGGALLELGGGSAGHTHRFVIGADELERLEAGNALEFTTSLDNGHQHLVRVSLNTQTRAWALEACSFGGPCTASALSAGSCTTDACPDGHARTAAVGPASR